MSGLRDRARRELARHYMEGVRHGIAESSRAMTNALDQVSDEERHRIEVGIRSAQRVMQLILDDIDANRDEHIEAYAAGLKRARS